MRPDKSKKEKLFSFGWGSGMIAEEAQVESRWDVPTLQLMKYTDGEAAGRINIRFCHYSHTGRFRRSPLMMSEDDVDAMREALKETPELREVLRRLVTDPEEKAKVTAATSALKRKPR